MHQGSTTVRTPSPAVALGVFALIAGSAVALLLEAATGDSVTIDEFAHLPAGLYYLHTGRFNVYNLSPPLLRLWCALPAWWAGAEADFSSFIMQPNHWLLGYHFLVRNAARYQHLFVLARLPTIVLTVALIAVLFCFARRAFGFAGGVTAALLAAFCPNVLAHGHLVTTDVGHALFFLLAVLAYERALRELRARDMCVAGLLLGVAQLTKFTALALYPLLALMTLIGTPRGMRRRAWGSFVACVALSLVVLNAGYLFSGFGTPLARFDLTMPGLRAIAASPLGRLPVPLPADFVDGYDKQMAEAQAQYTVYFHGALSRHGWWYYYPAAFVLKTPLPLLLLFVLGIVVWAGSGRLRRERLRSATLFLPPLLYVTLFSLVTDVNVGLRYILAVYPFVFLIAASVWAAPAARARGVQAVLAALVLTQVASAWLSRPYFLSYFNQLAGGSENGYRWLIDSNVDWGQELLRLRAYLRAHGIARVRLAYFGRVGPEVYDIDYELIPAEVTPAVYAVSASYLMGKPYYMYDHGRLLWAPENLYVDFQRYRPTAVLGHSLFIYDLRDAAAEP